uniref:Short-chain dehydrogenase/reductase 3 n=1 Tax=Arion vulgaris TaxID=1028688 RepID=A0A0B7BAK4_9EUPU
MHAVLDFLLTLKNVIVAFVVSWVRFFIPPDRKCVKGEIVLITGAGRGIGQSLALEFAKLKAVTVLWDISEKGLKETAKMITDAAGECHTYICDISDRQQIKVMGDRVKTEVGDVTILINNAGIVIGKTLLELRDEQIERTFGVNLLGQIWTTKHFLPSMLENNHGHIVNIGSSCGLVGVPKLVDYCASKFGVTGFTQTLNYEIHFSGHDGVFTTLVSPSHIKTGMFQGCEMMYPALLPSLELNFTVDRIMQAILTNQHELCIPRTLYFMAALKHMLPVSSMHEVIHMFRGETFMESFTGAKEDENQTQKDRRTQKTS